MVWPKSDDELTITWTSSILTETNERVDRATALEILSSLEFEPELECEHRNHGKVSWHEGPAELLIDFVQTPCVCGWVPSYSRMMLCRKAYDHAGRVGLACPKCRANEPRETWWHLVGGV